MDISFFDLEMKRLSNQWPNAYSPERIKIFFNAFRDVSNFDFRDAVTHCLATCKGSPLLKELTEAIHVAKNNYFQQKRVEEEKFNRGMFGIENNGGADQEFVKKCVELYESRYVKNEISYEQYQQGCDLLDQASKLFTNKKPTPTTITKPNNKPYKDDDDEKPF